MKNVKFLILLVFLMTQLGTVTTQADLPGDLVVFHDGYHDDFTDDHDTIDGLTANLTAAGSSVSTIGVNDSFAIPAASNVALFPGSDVAFEASELTAVSTWFESEGPKLLWVAADSDFGGFFNYANIHEILEAAGSKLRFVDGEIQDATSNDGQPYRVISTGFPTDGFVNKHTSEGVETIITHGPTGVIVEDGTNLIDPLAEDVSGVEVLATTADTSIGFDGDGSAGTYDFYDSATGPFPVVVIERVAEGKWVIASGESVFSDYKFMYGHVTEGGLTHDGQTFVDNILHWFSENGATEDLKDDDDAPFPFVGVIAGFLLIPILARRFRK